LSAPSSRGSSRRGSVRGTPTAPAVPILTPSSGRRIPSESHDGEGIVGSGAGPSQGMGELERSKEHSERRQRRRQPPRIPPFLVGQPDVHAIADESRALAGTRMMNRYRYRHGIYLSGGDIDGDGAGRLHWGIARTDGRRTATALSKALPAPGSTLGSAPGPATGSAAAEKAFAGAR